MSETDLVSTEAPTPRKRGGLTGMVLAELRQLAGELHISSTAGMRKGDLIAAIKERQGSAPTAQLSLGDAPGGSDGVAPAAAASAAAPAAAPAAPPATASAGAPAPTTRRRRTASRPAGAPAVQTPSATNGVAADAAAADATASSNGTAPVADGSATAGSTTASPSAPSGAVEPSSPASTQSVSPSTQSAPTSPPSTVDRSPDAGSNGVASVTGSATNGAGPAIADAPAEPETGGRRARQSRRNRAEQADTSADQGTDAGDDRRTRGTDSRAADRGIDNRAGDNRNGDRVAENRGTENRGTDNRGDTNRGRNDSARNDSARNDSRGPRDNRPDDDGDEDGDGRGRRGRRFRDRRRGRDRERPVGVQGGGQNNVDTEVRDGDVLLPVAGIIDVLDNYAFVRTTGYLSGPTDCYVSLSVVRRYGLRRGDAVTGAVREQREGEQSRQKFNPLVRVDSINGQDPDDLRDRPEFTKLTPLYPNERLRLETEPSKLTTRVIDLVMPIGKGQRALIVSPPKAGKTMIMQAIANAITTNNPECHLMVVLVDERPEEVTDMQRSVKGEVIASTFDRPPGDHTTVAELAIERAKRLVEMGHDVVVLLDSITRLGRAYNLAAPASGRILSGGVDSTALYPPKRFLGAARNIEDGGSLTIFATALVETGSTMDTVIFEEFKGTGNAELKLDRKIADKRVFPAIDIDASGTRKEELLLSPDELAVTVKLRRVLSALDDQQALDLVLNQLKKTRTNIEFLMQVAKNSPGTDQE